MNKTVRILLADDHPLFRQGIKNALNDCSFIDEIYEVSDGAETLLFFKDKKADILLLDIRMPKLNGFECAPKILKDHPEVKIIVLSSFEDKWHIEQMLEIGVKGYLLKNVTKPELEMAIESVMEGKMYFSPELVGKMLHRSVEFMNKEPDLEFGALLAREKVVLKLIYEEYNSQEIADKLNISEHTVKSYRKSLMLKTGSKNVVGLMKYALKQGWF